MPPTQELENWDDDFDFGSPRNSPLPAAAPIHHAVHRTRSQAATYQQRSHANLHSQSSLEHGLHHRRSSSRTNLGGSGHGLGSGSGSGSRGMHHPPSTSYLRPKETRQARWSGNSEEDWDMELADTTIRPLPPPLPSHQPSTTVAGSSTSTGPKPPTLALVSTIAPPPPPSLSSMDHDAQIVHLNHTRRSPSPSGNVSPTMSAFSIPLSANSSVRNPAHSIGGSSTNFLLHSGRRSLLEMEKGGRQQQQDRERRRLRKKSRPSAGAAMFDDDDQHHDAYMRTGVPRRYIPPIPPAGGGGGDSSSELDESGDDRGNLSELEEELALPSSSNKVARVDPSSARIPPSQPLPSTNLKPSSSRPMLSGVISTSRGIISSVVTSSSSPSSSSKPLPMANASSSTAAPPSKLSKKNSNSMMGGSKGTHHSSPRIGVGKSKSPPRAAGPLPSPQAQIQTTAAATSTSIAKGLEPTVMASPPRRSVDLNALQTSPTSQQHHDDSHHLNDCGSSIAASSHKARQPLLSRLSGLKRWGKAHSPSLLSSSKLPSMSTMAFPTTAANANASSADLPAVAGSSSTQVSPTTSPQKPQSTTTTPGKSRAFGLLRRPSLQFRNTSKNEDTANESSTMSAGDAPPPQNQQVSTLKDEGRRGLNPFRRVSITGMKRLVSDHHHTTESQSMTPNPSKTPDSKRMSSQQQQRVESPTPGADKTHQRTLSFMNRMRSKSGGNEAPPPEGKVTATKSGAGNADGGDLKMRVPHTVGRSAAMIKAPKPPVRTVLPGAGASASGTSSKINESSSSSSSSSSPVPPSSPASTSSPVQLPLAPPSGSGSGSSSVRLSSTMHSTPKGDRRTATMAAGTPGQDQDVTPRPSRHRQPPPEPSSSRDRTTPSHHHHHERERTTKATTPSSMTSASISRSGASAVVGAGGGSTGHLDSTPRALKAHKALPSDGLSNGTMAMTMGRVGGSNVLAAERKEKEGGVRRSSVGDSMAQRRGGSGTSGDLKIPTMISMKQNSLKRELEAVKEFATSVDDLKRLQSSYQAILSQVSSTGRHTSSRSAARQLAAVEQVGSQYAIWWECADLLIELGGAAPPTVAGTPLYEVPPNSPSPAYTTGTQRSHASTSSNGDLSNRQLQLLRQMLMTPNPRSFADPALASHAMKPSGSQATLSSDYSSAQSAEMSSGNTHSRPGHRKGELSGSGSDHVWSDIGSRRGTKSSIESGDSMHRSSSTRDFVQPAPANSPYVSGTWKDKAGKASSSSNTRPSLAGMFVKPGTDAGSSSASGTKSKGTATTVGATAKTKASKGAFDGSNSSSAAGRGTTDDDDDISDWDAESETGDQPSSLQSNSRYLTTPSTTTSSFDMLPTRLALTPENIVPLLEYAREVKYRLRECLTRLIPSLSTSTSATSTPSSGAIPYAYPSSSSRDYSSTTMTTTTTAGTTTLKRA